MKFLKTLSLIIFTSLLFSCSSGDSGDSGDLSDSDDLSIPVATIVTGDTKVTLSWNSVSGADKYNIYYATETFEDVEVANYASLNNYTLLENLTGASKEITNLTNGVKYYFVITSITTIDNIESTKSNQVTITPIAEPVLSNFLSPTLLYYGLPITTLIFTNNGGAVTSCSSKPTLPAGLSVTAFSDTCQITGTPSALVTATNYIITATNGTGSDIAEINIKVKLKDPVVTIVIEGAKVTLSWGSVSGVDKYNIYYATETFANIEVENYASLNGYALLENLTGTSKEITTLTDRIRYYFVITAIRTIDNIEVKSNQVTATLDLLKPVLVNPSSSVLFDYGLSIETLVFTNNGDTVISCSSDPTLPAGLSVTVSAGTCQITGIPSALVTATNYTISATNDMGFDTATINIEVKLKAPIATTVTGNTEVTLFWNSVSGAAKYNIYYATETFANIKVENYASLNGSTLLVNLTGTSKKITGLTNNTKYYFVVTAVKDAFESGGSNEIAVITKVVLNDTGITQGGGYPSSNNATCTGVEISAQDCSYGRDAKAVAGALIKVGGGNAGFDFTKLGSTGNVLNIQNATWRAGGTGTEDAGTKWSCVKDNHTGLIWEVKTDSGEKKHANIHHKGNRYKWGGKTALGKNHADKRGPYYDSWTSLVDGANTENFCGGNN
ncbi:hypothetical protein [uncultured Gammaproteobacteria bacterium]|jgi:hypothetical protein|nr:hypothetical protein [uncultured Gammaproteobacteria bacterium]CAC9590896.1 hypothetical protein [uncultured Gammaproteobacteria bacterium]